MLIDSGVRIICMRHAIPNASSATTHAINMPSIRSSFVILLLVIVLVSLCAESSLLIFGGNIKSLLVRHVYVFRSFVLFCLSHMILFYLVVISGGKNDSTCFITSTVHPFPSILYCCVLLHFHLYHSGIVCNLAHSVGVSLLIRKLSTISSAIIHAPPVRPAQHVGALCDISYTRFC